VKFHMAFWVYTPCNIRGINQWASLWTTKVTSLHLPVGMTATTPRWRCMSLSSLCPEDRGSKALRNCGILPQHYTASQPRRTGLESSSVSHEADWFLSAGSQTSR
jgi:hypothetical protein